MIWLMPWPGSLRVKTPSWSWITRAQSMMTTSTQKGKIEISKWKMLDREGMPREAVRRMLVVVRLMAAEVTSKGVVVIKEVTEATEEAGMKIGIRRTSIRERIEKKAKILGMMKGGTIGLTLALIEIRGYQTTTSPGAKARGHTVNRETSPNPNSGAEVATLTRSSKNTGPETTATPAPVVEAAELAVAEVASAADIAMT